MVPNTVRHFTLFFFYNLSLQSTFPYILIHVIGTDIFPVMETGNSRLLIPSLTFHVAIKLITNLL